MFGVKLTLTELKRLHIEADTGSDCIKRPYDVRDLLTKDVPKQSEIFTKTSLEMLRIIGFVNQVTYMFASIVCIYINV